MKKKTIIIFLMNIFLIILSLFLISCSKRNYEKQKKIVGENFCYTVNFILSYQSKYAVYPLPSWLFEDISYFDSYIHKLYEKDSNLLSEWDKLDNRTKKIILNGGKILSEDNKIKLIIDIINRRGIVSRNSPFCGYGNNKNGGLSINEEIFKDPFSNSKATIRYSLCYPEYIFCLISNGPDMDKDIDEKDVFGINIFKGYNPPDNNLLYDPTNGIRSNGDIFFTNYGLGDKYGYEDIFKSVSALKGIKLSKTMNERIWDNWKKEMLK